MDRDTAIPRTRFDSQSTLPGAELSGDTRPHKDDELSSPAPSIRQSRDVEKGDAASLRDYNNTTLQVADTVPLSHSDDQKETSPKTADQPPSPRAFNASEIVDWDGDDDPMRPMNWSSVRKWTIVMTSAAMTFTVAFGSSVFSATVEVVGAEYGVSSEVMLLGVALYVLGFAFGPMIWGPASELYGRTRPLWFGMFVFCIFQIPLGVARNLETIFLARFFAGLFGSAPLAIIAGMYVDFLPPVQYGISSAAFAAGVFCGPAFGPILGSYITESYLGWRWTAWITMIMGSTFTIICWSVTPETYAPVLLREKAARLRIETKNFALHAKSEESPVHLQEFATRYLTKPIKMFVAEPILIFLTIYMSFVYGILYLTFEAYPVSFTFDRGWSPSTGTLPFLGLLIGIMVACGIIAIFTQKYVLVRYMQTKKLNPEDRLPPMILGSILLPAGLFWFAWTSDPNIFWFPQVASGVFIGCGIILIFMASIVYLIDVYLMSANSAIAINTLVRSMVGAGFPMFATYMMKGLGVDWGMSVLGFVAVAIVPFPILFLKYGKKIRSWSKFSVG